jgi:hypothetical protein
LRMDFGVAVDFGGGGLEDAGTGALGEAEAVHGAEEGGFGGFDGVELVVRGGGGAGEVVDLVDLELEGVADVVADEFEAVVVEEVLDVAFSAGEEVVEADDFVAFVEEAFAEVGAEEAGSAGDEDAHGRWGWERVLLADGVDVEAEGAEGFVVEKVASVK